MSTMANVMDSKPSKDNIPQSQQLETLGLIASGIVHDFNNLLTSIMGQSSLALAKLPVENNARKHIEKALQAAEFATDLTRQLLDFASNNQVPAELISLNQLIKENAALISMSLNDNISLTLDLAPKSPPVLLKRTQIQQLIMNLIINSVESMQEARGRICIRTGLYHFYSVNSDIPLINNRNITLGDYVYIEVEDTGIGMDQAVKSKIFSPFFTTKVNGNGLGLATILKTVEDQHGAIAVKSKPGKGTTFTIFFPISHPNGFLQ